MADNSIASNRSALKDFLGSVATMSGDLSNVTAPPFVLAENSTVEIPQYWCDHAHLWVAPAAEENVERRALLVLEGFLGSLRNQQYAGREEKEGIKKPLNAFLGELFIGTWKEEDLGETKLVAEQVSHHPPITACYLWNDKHGVRAEGFTEQEITFSGNVTIKQRGYAVTHLDKYDEDYLIPMPGIKVKGILTGVPYPELHGDYSLVGSNGYTSRIKFGGKSFWGGGQKNGFEAEMFHVDKPQETLYSVKGAWNGSWTVTDARTGTQIDTFDVTAIPSTPMHVAALQDQDAWESRRAWQAVISALRRGDMKGTADAKSVLEDGQRQMRSDEEARGEPWQALFFQNVDRDPVFEALAAHDPSFTIDRAQGFWKINTDAIARAKKPYHGALLPTNQRAQEPDSVGSDHHGATNSATTTTTTTRAAHDAAPAPALAAAGSPPVASPAPKAPQNAEEPPASPYDDDRPAAVGDAPSRAGAVGTGPTDAQVESYLRNKYSTSSRA
jgi:hypothetical protein